jgi:hypothetical protein
MNRRNFLRKISLAATATVVAPVVLTRFTPPDVIAGTDPISKDALSTIILKGCRTGRQWVMLTGQKGMENFHEAVREHALNYCKV